MKSQDELYLTLYCAALQGVLACDRYSNDAKAAREIADLAMEEVQDEFIQIAKARDVLNAAKSPRGIVIQQAALSILEWLRESPMTVEQIETWVSSVKK